MKNIFTKDKNSENNLAGVFFIVTLCLVLLAICTYYFMQNNQPHVPHNTVWLGIEVLPIDPAVARNFGLRFHHGLLIRSVINGSPADKAGLEDNDIIRMLDGKRIFHTTELTQIIGTKNPGDGARIVYLRHGLTFTAHAILEEPPKADWNIKLVTGAVPVVQPPTDIPYPYFHFGDEEDN